MIPTDEQLQAAYRRQLPYRPNWPSTYAEAIANPMIRHMLIAFVRADVPAFGRRKAPRAGRLPWKGPHLAPGERDMKKAASGDKED